MRPPATIARSARFAVVAAVLMTVAGKASAQDAPPARAEPAKSEPAKPEAAKVDTKTRLFEASELKKKDVAEFAKSLADMGGAQPAEKDATRDFLQQYALQERDRALRMVALEALSRLDRRAAAEWFKAKVTADDANQLVKCVSLEALGLLGSQDDASVALELIKSADELIAVQATNTAARLCPGKDVPTIVEYGLAHKQQHVTDHAGWAVQDILKKTKNAIGVFQKIADKKTDPRAERASSIVAMLQDKLAEPHEWTDPLTKARKLVLEAQDKVEIKTNSKEYQKNCLDAMQWLKTNLPGAELLVRASTKRIDIPGADDRGWIDPQGEIIQIPLAKAIEPPHKMAYHLTLMASVLWQKRLGEPYKAHRGWEPGLFDIYDLCVIAKLYDAGPGGLSRARFVKDQVEKHPWGSQ